MDFPHLEGATGFPFNPEPAPYQTYRNTFDYTVWDAGTSVKLLSVPWDSANVVDFSSEKARDEWFKAQDGFAVTMQTPQRMAGKEIKIPLPYDMGALYNYAWVEFTPAPVEGEDAERGVMKWGFFIDSLDYRAPSATALTLSVDWWTTFLQRLTIPSVHLVQGHWAVAHSATPAAFLNDPLAHTENLLDNEGDTLSSGRQVNDVLSEQWNTGDQLAVIDTGLTNPGGDYSGAMPTLPRLQTINSTPAGRMTAVTPGQLSTFLNNAPAGLLASIRALYIVPRRLLSLGDAQTLYGATVWQVLATTSINHDVKLKTSDFNYPAEAAGYAKLYTGQYARLQLSTESGQTVNIPIEQIGASAALHAQAAAGAGLAIMSYLAGVGTEASGTVTLKRLDTSATPPGKGSWQETLLEWDVPSYQVLISAADLATWQKTYERDNRRSNALAAYRNAVASADTAKTNTDASADTAKTNTDTSADTTKTNTDTSADTTKTNTDTSADTAYTNGVQSAQTSYRNDLFGLDARRATAVNQNMINSAYRYQDKEQTFLLLDNSMSKQIKTLGVTITGSETAHNNFINGTGTYDSSLTGSVLWKTAADGNAAFTEYTAMQDLDIKTQKDRQRVNLAVTAANTAIDMVTGEGDVLAGAIAGQVTGPKSQGAKDTLVQANQIQTSFDQTGAAAKAAVTVIGANANINITQDNNIESRAIQARYLTGQETTTPDFDTAVGTGSNTGTISIATRASIYQNFIQRLQAVKATVLNQDNLDYRTQFSSSYRVIEAESAIAAGLAVAGNTLHSQIGGKEVAYKEGEDQTIRLNVKAEDNNPEYRDVTYIPVSTKDDGTLTGTIPRTRDTTKANATRSRDTTKANATRSQSTTKANAVRSRDTTKANAKRTHDTAVTNAKRTYDATLDTVTAGVNTDNRGIPVAVTDPTGDASLWTVTPVGVTVRVDRPLDGDLIRIADRMNRFGYMCRRLITSPKLLQMPEWTYWHCDAATVKPAASGAPRAAVEYVRGALLRGVTVWAKPEQIGDVEQ